MDYFLDDSFLDADSENRIWDKKVVAKILKIIDEVSMSETTESKERRFLEFLLEIKMANNEFLHNIDYLPTIMDCRSKADQNSHFGGLECAELAESFYNACEKYLSFSQKNTRFVEGSLENLVLKIREKARKDEKYAWYVENENKNNYLSTGIDNTMQILKMAGYSK